MNLPRSISSFFFCDLLSFSVVSILILFSLISLSIILHFHVKAPFFKFWHHRDFNSLWPVRLLLVVAAFLCAVSELLRLPIFRHLLQLSVEEEATLCKIYVVSSQGLFQPAFFVTLLFLLNASLTKTTATLSTADGSLLSGDWIRAQRALSIVIFSCLPLLIIQIIFVFYSERILVGHSNTRLLEYFKRHSVVIEVPKDPKQPPLVLCAYPLFSTIVLAGFGVIYMASFVVVCWRAIEVVINRSLRVRIYGIASAVLCAIPLQILCLLLSLLWDPHTKAFELLSLVAFFCIMVCVLVGEGLLVIRPIVDAMAVGTR